MEKKIIGILGGMGPLATADLFKKIIEAAEAGCDQEHARVIIDSNTNIPDRTAAILHGGKDPVPELTESARLLEKAGAGLLIMPCNTAHFFYESVKAAVSIPVISMIEAAASRVVSEGRDRALILCTDGTRDAGVYDRVFAARGIKTFYPDEKVQKALMSIIYEGVKAGVKLSDGDERAQKIRECVELVNAYIEKQGDVITLLSCTELPIARDIYGLKGNFADPTDCLARAAITAAGYKTK